MTIRASKQDKSPNEETTEKLGINGIGLLDFLFTFSLATGLIEGAFRREWTSLEDWPQTLAWPTSNDTSVSITLLYAILTLSFSWYGYHVSIDRKPHKDGTWQGFVRFQIDVVLVLLYGVLLLSVENITAVLGISVFIYFLYAIWDHLQNAEYPNPETRSSRNHPWIWFVGFLGAFLLSIFTPIPTIALSVLALCFSVVYRFSKVQNGRTSKPA